MRSAGRNRRDWGLLIFIVPLGIFLMMIAGQVAMRIIPRWTLNVGMGSNLEVGDGGGIPLLFNFQILTPFAWQDTYLTPNPGDGFVFPPFIVIEPVSTFVPTAQPTSIPATTEVSVISTATPQPSSTVYVPPPPVTASGQPTIVPTTTPKISTEIPPSVTPVTPSVTPITPSATPVTPSVTPITPTDPPTPVPTGFPSTPDPSWVPIPGPAGIVIGPPDGVSTVLDQGYFTVIDLGVGNSIEIIGTDVPSDGYDLAYFEVEYNNGTPQGYIHLDNVMLGISTFSDGSIFYRIFDWGDINGVVTNDYNTNISSLIEMDNLIIPITDLFSYLSISTGILIDADTAASQPPPATYRYLVVLAPVKVPPAPDTIDVDSILIWP